MNLQKMYESGENKAVMTLVTLFVVFHFAVVMLLT